MLYKACKVIHIMLNQDITTKCVKQIEAAAGIEAVILLLITTTN